MNLLTINTYELIKLIDQYKNQYKSSIDDERVQVNPILLMNEDTMDILKKQTSEVFLLNTDKTCKLFNGCYIAIANWFPLGEVQLK